MKSLLVSAVLAASFAQAQPVLTNVQQRRLTTLDQIEAIFQTQYAPKAWKNHFAGWELKMSMDSARAAVRAEPTMTLADFQKVLAQFFLSTKDYHVGYAFAATESASLPFSVKGAEGRYFLSYIDRSKLPASAFPFQVGDEVVGFGGRPVSHVVDELMLAQGGNVAETDRMLAELNLTRRSARKAVTVPKGPVEVRVKGAAGEKSVQLIWDYSKEVISDNGFSPLATHATIEPKASRFDFNMVSGSQAIFSDWLAEQADNPHLIGARQSFIPDLGAKIWESDAKNPFYAYIFRSQVDGKLVGYVRIASYSRSALGDETEAMTKAFAEIIKKFQSTTDSMIIDQVNNPGGSVFYLYALVSMLTDEPFFTPAHRMSLNQKDVKESYTELQTLVNVKSDEDARKAMGETINGYPVNYSVAQFFRTYLQFQVDEWHAGRTLTEPHFLGVDKINPHPEVNYTKPILFLTNALDFSGGDFMPAILQDNKRVTILGTRTAGAGGYVNSVEFPNHAGLETFSLTASIAERVSKNPIENLGVKPDIEYTPTADDLQNNYRGYVDAILKATSKL